jgi:tetraacyldisaccharide 4'-kinase
MVSWRRILLPFSWLFFGIVGMRNLFYDRGIFKSKTYSRALIGIGNIRVGGTGKSPFTEYLIYLLSPVYKIAVLSRGYGRKTKGFLEVEKPDAFQFGDEPSQFKSRFPSLKVYVSENRVLALDKINPSEEVILLDDVFQHRKIKAGMYWVLMEYSDLEAPIEGLPAGNYREGLSALKRAQCILITKCKGEIKEEEVQRIRAFLSLKPDQALYFSAIHYLPLKRLTSPGLSPEIFREKALESEQNLSTKIPLFPNNFDFILVFTGIGNYKPFEEYLKGLSIRVEFIPFPDHHSFSLKDIGNIRSRFDREISRSKIILTTEKDAQRLREKDFDPFIREYPVYFQPIQFQILNNQEEEIKKLVFQYVESTL